MNNTKPAVSIIMSEYNTDINHLKESIESLLQQTFSNFELILIDDCGKSDVNKVVSEIGKDPRIKIVRNKQNLGLVKSLNRAINLSNAPYLVRMDTDDIALKNRIETLYNFAINHPEYSVIGSTAIEFSSTKEKGILGKPGAKSPRDIMRGDVPIHPSVIMKKDDIIAVGKYPNFNRAEDLALWCELLLAGKKIYNIDEPLLKYRVEDTDYNKRTLRRRKGEIKARLHYYPKLGARPIEYIRIIKSVVAGLLPGCITRQYREKFITRSSNNAIKK